MDSESILKQIAGELAKVPRYGQLQINIKRHLDQFNSVHFSHIESQKMEGDTAQMKAVEHILKMYKQATEQANAQKKNTTLSFTAVIDGNGRNVQVLAQDYKKL
jgi:hypothetical protein